MGICSRHHRSSKRIFEPSLHGGLRAKTRAALHAPEMRNGTSKGTIKADTLTVIATAAVMANRRRGLRFANYSVLVLLAASIASAMTLSIPRLTGALAALFMLTALTVGAAGPASDPEMEYRALATLARAQLPAALRSGPDEAAKIEWFRQRKAELHARGAAFLERHATHPLRWDVLVLLRYGGEDREKIYRSGFRQLVPVPESQAAWNKKYFADLERLLVAADASGAAREEALRQLIDHTSRSALRTPAEAPTIIPRVRAWLDRYDREFPRSRYVVFLYHCFTDLLDAAAPDLCIAFLAELERRYIRGEYLDKQVQELVSGHRRMLEAQAQPLDEFWARLREFDPVAGDGARYRGKVVLVALGPLTYETLMESLEDLHAAHAADGLVLLQVASFNNNMGLPPEADQRRDMEKLVALRRCPWPVLWNPHAHMDLVKKWGYNSIPVLMLIGRDGRLVLDRNTPLSAAIPRELARTEER